MAKALNRNKSNDDENEVIEDLTVVDNPNDSSIDEEDEDEDEVSIESIPLDEFIKDPEKAAKYTDDTDVEETTAYCPQCSDYTIFVNGICTNCGFTKTSKKNNQDDEKDEESTGFDFVPDEDIGMELGYNEDEDSYE